MKTVAVIGSTGSIGTQALDVIRHRRKEFQVAALSCHENLPLLYQQIEEFHPHVVGISDEAAYREAKAYLGERVKLLGGSEAHSGCVEESDAHITLISVVGFAGLAPLAASIRLHKQTCVANKESIVCGGAAIRELAQIHGVEILPVDSEHNAIYQCLMGNRDKNIAKIHLTCSGGPFLRWSRREMTTATWEQALKHPKWNMGRKISIDSATLANKGLEVLEAKWLFAVELDQIQVVVHPQSILHSAVEYMDSSVIGQMGNPDMRIPIAYAFSYPERMDLSDVTQPLDLFSLKEGMSFYPADRSVFKTIDLAYEACREGGSCPVVLNGANEVLVDLFLHGKIRFIDIQNFLIQMMETHQTKRNLDLETILEEDMRGREDVRKLVEKTI